MIRHLLIRGCTTLMHLRFPSTELERRVAQQSSRGKDKK
jgi:hypothetical protein